MKWIFLLVIAVVLMVGIWFLVGSARHPEEARTLEIPTVASGKPALIKASQQFVVLDLRRVYQRDAAELVRVVTEGLGDEDWPAVQSAIFRGWEVTRAGVEAREILAPVQEVLLRRLVEFGSQPELVSLMDVADRDGTWKPPVNEALLRAVSREVSVAAAGKAPLFAILAAAVAKRDWERASLFVTKARFEAGVPDALKDPVVHLEEALRLLYEARQQTPAMAKVVSLWASGPADALPAPVLVGIGIDLAKSGQESQEYGKLTQAINDSKGQPRAKEYWAQALSAFGDSLPEQGAYMNAPALDALSRSVGEGFPDKAAEVRFWKSLAAKSTVENVGEGMWRVECLKKAYRASSDPAEKVGLLKEIAAGYRKWMPGAAQAIVGELAAEIPAGEKSADLAPILDDARKTTAAHEAGRKKLQDELAQLPTKTTIDLLKKQLADLKSNKGNPDVIANVEKQIKELERKLTE